MSIDVQLSPLCPPLILLVFSLSLSWEVCFHWTCLYSSTHHHFSSSRKPAHDYLHHLFTWESEESCSIERWDDHQLQTACLSGWLSLSLPHLHSLLFPSSCTLRIHCTSWCCDMVLVLQVYGSCKKCVCASLIMQCCLFHPDLHFHPESNEISPCNVHYHTRY